MNESVERGLKALRLYKGTVQSKETDKVVIEFATPDKAMWWRATYAKRATTKFVPSKSDGVRLEVKG